MQPLGGPPTTYVGHRLRTLPAMLDVRTRQSERTNRGAQKTIVLLPGSRKTEVSRLLPIFGETASILASRGDYRFVIPAVPEPGWPNQAGGRGLANKTQIVTGENAKWTAFATADAALAAAATVLFRARADRHSDDCDLQD